jgi:hypothetical protein
VTTLKLILGGIVAVVSAFGMTLAVLFALALAASNQKATGFGAVAGSFTAVLRSGWFWLAVLVIFSIGFFLAYRKLYF